MSDAHQANIYLIKTQYETDEFHFTIHWWFVSNKSSVQQKQNSEDHHLFEMTLVFDQSNTFLLNKSKKHTNKTKRLTFEQHCNHFCSNQCFMAMHLFYFLDMYRNCFMLHFVCGRWHLYRLCGSVYVHINVHENSLDDLLSMWQLHRPSCKFYVDGST